ncbi:MAG: NAD-dependent epimerase/dehydratase family protein, partial [Gammaproteobacteria bacterium]
MGNQKICLLGATGFIGSSISDALTEANLDWIGLTRHPSSHKNLQQVSYEDATIVCEIINEYPVVINALGSLKPKDFICDFKNSLESFWTMNNVLET